MCSCEFLLPVKKHQLLPFNLSGQPLETADKEVIVVKMASAEQLHLIARSKGDGNVNKQSSVAVTYAEDASTIAVTYVEDALKALTVQSDPVKVSSHILLQHANSSRGGQIPVDNTETHIISSDFEQMKLSKNDQENICESKEKDIKTAEENENYITVEKVGKCNVNAGEKEGINECDCIQVSNTERELLKEELKLLQCPFTWNLNFKNGRTTTEGLIAKCNDKLSGEEEEENDDDNDEGFKWRTFIFTLILGHELYVSGSSSEALTKLQECKNLISKCQSMEKPDRFFQNVKEALLHVVNASKCHLLVSLNMFNDAVKLKHGISRYEDMDRQNMAAVFGIQSAMLMEYGFEGTKAALEYAEKAVNLDGNEGEWHFLYGKALGRIRRVENFTEIPTQQELSALEQSVRISKTAPRIVFLAQAYREAAAKAFGKNRNNLDSLKHMLTKMNEKSLQLYWEALNLKDNNVRVNIRCAAGLLKLPRPFQDLKKAEEIIEKALNIAPNNAMANHIAGNLYERLSKFDLAEKFYKKSEELGVYGACMNLLTMKIKRDRKYDPLPELEEMLQQFTEVTRLQETYLQMGSYVFHFKNDTFAALDYWMKGIEIDPDAEKLKAHKCSFLDMKTAVNLYQIIADEIRLSLEQNTHTDENILKLRKMLHFCSEKYPELLINKPKSWRHSLKQQNIQEGRRKNQNNGREAGQWHRNKHPQQWRHETQEEDRKGFEKSSRRSSGRNDNLRNRDHLQYKQHENWRHSPRNASFSEEHNPKNSSFSDEVSDSVIKDSDNASSLSASNSMENYREENISNKRNWNQQLSATNEGFRRDEKWQTNAQEKHQLQQSHKDSWRYKDHSSPEQHVQNEILHNRRKNKDKKFGKYGSSERS